MFEGSTIGRYKFFCEGFNFHFDKASELEAHVDWLKSRGCQISGKEYKIWDKRSGASVPAKTGKIS